MYEIIVGTIAEIRPIIFLLYMTSAKSKTSFSWRFMEKTKSILLSVRRATESNSKSVTRFMHNDPKWPNILKKYCGVNKVRLLKYVWPFFIIIYEKVNRFASWLGGSSYWQQYNFALNIKHFFLTISLIYTLTVYYV